MRTPNILFVLTIIFSCNQKKDKFSSAELQDGKGDFTYKTNSADSTAIFYARDKKTLSTGKYINNKRQGTWEEFVTDPKDKNRIPEYKSAEYIYQDDEKTGLYKSYTATGKVDVIGYFKYDVPDSVFVYFDLKGKVEKVEVWKADKGSSELIYSKDYRTP